MAHEVETMFYVNNQTVNGENVRFVPWHGLGTPVSEALTSKEALEVAGLNWKVNPSPVYIENHIQIPGYVANVRDTDNAILGIVTGRYQIVQNEEAFDFTDALIGEGCKYVTAGSLRDGKKIWLLAQLPSDTILGDEVDTYLCFTNSHDGTGAIRACCTPTRVVCNNTLNLALDNATRSWSTKHIGDIKSKLEAAKQSLSHAAHYMEELKVTAEKMANETMTKDEVTDFIVSLFPIQKDDSDRKKANANKQIEDVYTCYFAPDLVKFAQTKWGMIQAIADYVDHNEPARKSSNYNENRWEMVMNGHPLLDLAFSKLQ